MSGKFIATTKYAFFAFIAFIVPKLIVDSGRIVAPLEPNENDAHSNVKQENPNSSSIWPFCLLRSSPNPAALTASSTSAPQNVGSVYANYGDHDGLNASANEGKYGESSASSSENAYLFNDDDNFNGVQDGESDAFASSASTYRNEFTCLSTSKSSFRAFSKTPTKPLEEIFRFGHSPRWLVDSWSRVDAVPADAGLVGYRVVVATGANVDDLVGVLTCYFDATSERKIVFSGQTGDYRKTLSFLEREYGVALAPNSTAAQLQYESTLKTALPNVPPSRFVVRPTRVFLQGAEKSFFDVDVVLERPYN